MWVTQAHGATSNAKEEKDGENSRGRSGKMEELRESSKYVVILIKEFSVEYGITKYFIDAK